MNQIIDALRQLFGIFKIWMVIAPWEQSVRVRFGKHATLLHSGFYWRFPIFDVFYTQSTRERVSVCDRQLITSNSGKVYTVASTVFYEITDLSMLYNTLHQAEDVIRNQARALLCCAMLEDNDTILRLESVVSARLRTLLSKHGMSLNKFAIHEFAAVKTYRIVGDTGANWLHGKALDTTTHSEAPQS